MKHDQHIFKQLSEIRGLKEIQLVVGGFGFIGQYLTWGLLQKGLNVVLIARNNANNRAEKLKQKNSFANPRYKLSENNFDQLTIISGDLNKPNLGLSSASYRQLCSLNIGSIWNSAADMHYSYSNLQQSINTNVIGVNRLIDIAVTAKCRLNQISTAFIAGKAHANGIAINEVLYRPGNFFNAYDYTKNIAENLIAESKNLEYTIYRPTIVLGDSVSGYTNSESGYYEYVKLLNRLKKQHVEIPIHLKYTPGCFINVIPVDICCDAILKISEKHEATRNQYFNIADSNPMTVDNFIKFNRNYFKLDLRQFIENHTSLSNLSEREKRLLKIINRMQNGPFLNSDFRFSSVNSQEVLGHPVQNQWCNSNSYLTKVVDYFLNQTS
ncbi:SDR family oxidoreductase [Microbulbifer sp. JMSA004]|uniref:SDR family oxidoreductase n=1 Tax=unclassified Microbulbifer TaxID=2619833 RepID=UPI0024AC9A14|nr:SDR family oxidoreductase [Microbulbifer sp. VAAF005]WHI48135.1 SDR family oxidoreductase [Microbulbifer sp. VAAF005]